MERLLYVEARQKNQAVKNQVDAMFKNIKSILKFTRQPGGQSDIV